LSSKKDGVLIGKNVAKSAVADKCAQREAIQLFVGRQDAAKLAGVKQQMSVRPATASEVIGKQRSDSPLLHSPSSDDVAQIKTKTSSLPAVVKVSLKQQCLCSVCVAMHSSQLHAASDALQQRSAATIQVSALTHVVQLLKLNNLL
jgi:hypothetical protein